MTVFLRLVDAEDKGASLRTLTSDHFAAGRCAIPSHSFAAIPGSPFAYWCGGRIRAVFSEPSNRAVDAYSGGKTLDDPRFIRACWEVASPSWRGFAKGGAFSRFFSDVYLCMNWKDDARELKTYLVDYRESRGWSPNWAAELHSASQYFRPGLTWPRRTQSGLGMRAMPAGCIFADKGPAAFVEGDGPSDLLALLAITTSSPFRYLVELQMAFGSYEVGVIQRTPVPAFSTPNRDRLASLAREAWLLKRTLDTINETSHAYFLPRPLRTRASTVDLAAVDSDLMDIQRKIDELAFDLYGITGEDRAQIEVWSRQSSATSEGNEAAAAAAADEEDDSGNSTVDADDSLDLVSWAIGVAFGRFDLRLATGERAVPPEPQPFDPLPIRSSGMLPEGDPPFRQGTGILVDDPGHRDDLTAVVTSVLNAVKVEPPPDLRRSLARDFFPFHIQHYSKSRRKAPIYWQLATQSASYSVWMYLHAISADTLYKVQNDYAGPKLRHEAQKLDGLRRECGENPTASQRKELDSQETFVAELRIFLDEVKRVAPLWKPDLDDGVIINFAPLWRLVPHHRPWQKECKTTWDALADGDYDWSHLAMHLWPERVVPNCAKDRSLAIAHGLEEIFWAEDSDGKWKARPTPTRPLADTIKDRTSAAVKAALESPMSGPQSGGVATQVRRSGPRRGKIESKP
jgi:hypothetical protein